MMRMIVSAVAEQAIREIDADPRRGLRKMVDLGRELANGPAQQGFFRLTQAMLADPDSPYYALLGRTVRQTRREALREFAVNLGWNCWTVGAQRIRQIAATRAYQIPWVLTLHLDGTEDGAALRNLLEEGQALGCWGTICFAENPTGAQTAFALAQAAPENAFALFAPPAVWDETMTARAAAHSNVMLSVETTEGFVEAADRLCQAGCLYGAHRFYQDAAGVQEILSGAWIERMQAHAGLTMTAVAAPDCPPVCAQQVGQYMLACRTAQRYSVLPVDFFADERRVNRIVSAGRGRFFCVQPDGTVLTRRADMPAATGCRLSDGALSTLLAAMEH